MSIQKPARAMLRMVFFMLFASVIISGCVTHKSSVSVPEQWVTKKTLIRECDRGWIKYKVYLMPASNTNAIARHSRKEKVPLVLNIMIINMQTDASPLRALSGSLEQYNTYYEYLLNQAKNDFVLLDGNKVQYPISYAFENNYNAFPFETINIGYAGEVRPNAARLKNKRLLYMDKIFSHDTILLNLGQTLPL